MSHPPLHLTARDFDAYAAEKATSNAYSRPRLEVKQRALAWARSVVARLAELGISVDVHGSDEHPTLRNKKRVECQWVFFWRDEAAREELERLLDQGRSISAVIDDPSPYTRHAFLALRVDTHAVEVCFAVHPDAQVDVDNLHARLGVEGALAVELIHALAALPEEFTIGTGPEDRIACSTATPEAIRSMLERAAAGQVPLWIGWRVGRETAAEHSTILDEQLEDAIIALAPIYQLVAWSRDNDRIALDRRLEGIEEERARTHAAAEAQNERWRAEQEEARRRSQEQALARGEEARRAGPAVPPGHGARRPSLGTLFGPPKSPPAADGGPKPRGGHAGPKPAADGAANGPKPAADGAANGPKTRAPSEPSPKPQAAPSPLPQAALHRGGLASELAPSPDPATPAPAPDRPPPSPRPVTLEKGVRVRVRSGPFADKVGILGELDGRGSARVLLGLLSTRLDLTDLEPAVEVRERPAMQSSHRRPLPPAPRKAR